MAVPQRKIPPLSHSVPLVLRQYEQIMVAAPGSIPLAFKPIRHLTKDELLDYWNSPTANQDREMVKAYIIVAMMIADLDAIYRLLPSAEHTLLPPGFWFPRDTLVIHRHCPIHPHRILGNFQDSAPDPALPGAPVLRCDGPHRWVEAPRVVCGLSGDNDWLLSPPPARRTRERSRSPPARAGNFY